MPGYSCFASPSRLPDRSTRAGQLRSLQTSDVLLFEGITLNDRQTDLLSTDRARPVIWTVTIRAFIAGNDAR
jgi:hypothetical protein